MSRFPGEPSRKLGYSSGRIDGFLTVYTPVQVGREKATTGDDDCDGPDAFNHYLPISRKNYPSFRVDEREKRAKNFVIARINNPAGFLGGSR